MITHEIVLSAEEKRREIILVLQGEAESRKILISLEHNNRLVSMVHGAVNLYVQKPSGAVVFLAGEKDEANEKASFVLTKSACSEPGYCRCCLQIVYEDKSELRAEGLELLVLPCDLENAVEGVSEFSALQEALAQVVFYKEHTEDTENPHSVTAEQVGARPADWLPTPEEIGARSSDWVPTAEEVGARPNTWLPAASEIGAMRANAVIPINQGGTGATDAGTARKGLGFAKKLWSGNWAEGTITVPEADAYRVFAVRFYNTQASITNYTAIGMRINNSLRMIGGGTSGAANQFLVTASMTINGTEFSDLSATAFSHKPGDVHSEGYVYVIAEIWGIC